MSDLSWWTEDKNDYMMRYLDTELDRIRNDREQLLPNRIRVTCVRCHATVVEVVKITLPDDAQTLVYAIGCHKFSEPPLDIDLPAGAKPDELARARAEARNARDESRRSARRRAREWIYALQGSIARLMVQVGHECVDDQGEQFFDERLLAGQKIVDGEISAVDPGDDEYRRRPPGLD
jgi:hypothetical protein